MCCTVLLLPFTLCETTDVRANLLSVITLGSILWFLIYKYDFKLCSNFDTPRHCSLRGQVSSEHKQKRCKTEISDRCYIKGLVFLISDTNPVLLFLLVNSGASTSRGRVLVV